MSASSIDEWRLQHLEHRGPHMADQNWQAAQRQHGDRNGQMRGYILEFPPPTQLRKTNRDHSAGRQVTGAQ